MFKPALSHDAQASLTLLAHVSLPVLPHSNRAFRRMHELPEPGLRQSEHLPGFADFGRGHLFLTIHT